MAIAKEFDISVDTSQAQTFFAKLAARLQGQAQFRKAAAKIIERYVNQSFASEKTPGGVAWANLRPSTITQRIRQGFIPIRKLQASGAGKAGITILPSDRGVVIRISQDYMQFHNTGTSKMVARRWAPTADELSNGPIATELGQAATEFLTQGLGGFVKGEIGRTSDFVGRLLG